MKVSENRQQPYEAKEVMVQCTACSKYAVIVFPSNPTAEQRAFAIKEAADEHRKWCPATQPEEGREYQIWYPRV